MHLQEPSRLPAQCPLDGSLPRPATQWFKVLFLHMLDPILPSGLAARHVVRLISRVDPGSGFELKAWGLGVEGSRFGV